MEIEKDDREFSDNEALSRFSKNTRKTLADARAKIRVNTQGKGYSRKNPKHLRSFNAGFDLLQFNIAVKPYILKKYKVENPLELDILLYLYPIQFFTRADFKILPIKQYNYHLKTMINLGYIEQSIEAQLGKSAAVFTLTRRATTIVTEYYKYLSGEKVLNDKSNTNPFRGEDSKKIDLEREKVLLKLKHQMETQPDSFRSRLF